LLESVISDRELQFAVRLIKELNEMLEIKMKLSMAFYLQTDGQIERKNQELKQYLRMYINHRQNNWLEWLTTIEFVFNNKVYIVTKASPFKVNYGKEPSICFKIRKKGKHAKAEEFVKEMKKIHEKVEVALRKSQEEIKKYRDRNRNNVEYKVGNRMLISIKDFTPQMMKISMKKLIEKYIG